MGKSLEEMCRLVTGAGAWHIIGKKIVLYKEGKDEKKKIELPR